MTDNSQRNRGIKTSDFMTVSALHSDPTDVQKKIALRNRHKITRFNSMISLKRLRLEIDASKYKKYTLFGLFRNSNISRTSLDAEKVQLLFSKGTGELRRVVDCSSYIRCEIDTFSIICSFSREKQLLIIIM